MYEGSVSTEGRASAGGGPWSALLGAHGEQNPEMGRVGLHPEDHKALPRQLVGPRPVYPG